MSQGTERYGDLRIHAKGHIDYWAELQAAGTVPNDIPYEEAPRGRVSYDALNDSYLLLRDRCIPAKEIRKLISTLNLPKAKVVIQFDSHYRCSRCMKVGRHEQD